MAIEIEKRTAYIQSPIKIAVMGCEGNGPGEARDADIGMALGEGCAIIFVKGEFEEKVSGSQEDIIKGFLAQIKLHFSEVLRS
jgi:(E)-4-hydroxy-3-methylbut-2-enyl-diphosphate synthase